jgi:hypothetical protein
VFNFSGYKSDANWKKSLRFHFTPLRMAIIEVNNNNNNKYWWGFGKTGTLIHCWWECKLVQPLWKAVRRFLKKLKVELPYDPVILHLGIYPKNGRQDTTEALYTDVHCRTIHNSRALESALVPTMMNGSRNCGTYTQWSITQPQGMMTCDLKVNGCNWKTSC